VKSLAAFVMRGRWAAVLVLVAASLMPLLAWLGGAALALVTLRRGGADGALTGLVAAVVFGVLAAASGSPPQAALLVLLEFWLPVWLVAVWLRWSVSLSSALQLAAVLAGVAVVGFYLVHGDPGQFWQAQLEAARQQLGVSEANADAWQSLVNELLPYMTGLWALNLLGVVIVSVLLGRWWQALLYNPGGFRAEFHQLRLGRTFAVAAALLVLGGILSGAGLVSDTGFVVSSIFVLQALAVAHGVAALRSWNLIGLVAVYLLLPFLFRVYAAIGIADVFVDVRRRLAGGGTSSGA